MEDQCRVLAAAVETLDDVFDVYDADGKLAYWNARLNELFGLTDGELSGMDPTEFFVADDRAAVEAPSRTFSSRVRTRRDDVETTARYTLQLSGGSKSEIYVPLGDHGVGRDITDRREREWHLSDNTSGSRSSPTCGTRPPDAACRHQRPPRTRCRGAVARGIDAVQRRATADRTNYRGMRTATRE